MNTEDILKEIKNIYEDTIRTAKFNGVSYANGSKAKEALIRSSKLINLLHNLVKNQLVSIGINQKLIHPPLNKTGPEIKLEGFLKTKNQDICVVPPSGELDDKVLSINVRSQLSSMQKNIDTLYERTFAEALNLHLMNPAQCLGEVYLIPTHEYADKPMLDNKVEYKKVSKLENYIKMFQAINSRDGIKGDEYKYERVTLLIVDFQLEQPKLYSTIDELKADGLIPQDSLVQFTGLEFETFSSDLAKIYQERFGNQLTS